MRSYSFRSNVDLLITSRKPSGGPNKAPAPGTPPPASQSRVPGGAAPPPGSSSPPHGFRENPERGIGATLGGPGTGMLSRTAGLVLLRRRPRPPASSRLVWVPGEEDILSFLAIPLFRALRSLTSSPSGPSRSRSVDVPGEGWQGPTIPLTPPPPGALLGRGVTWRGLLHPKVCAAGSADPLSPTDAAREARAAALGPVLISPPFCPFGISQ